MQRIDRDRIPYVPPIQQPQQLTSARFLQLSQNVTAEQVSSYISSYTHADLNYFLYHGEERDALNQLSEAQQQQDRSHYTIEALRYAFTHSHLGVERTLAYLAQHGITQEDFMSFLQNPTAHFSSIIPPTSWNFLSSTVRRIGSHVLSEFMAHHGITTQVLINFLRRHGVQEDFINQYVDNPGNTSPTIYGHRHESDLSYFYYANQNTETFKAYFRTAYERLSQGRLLGFLAQHGITPIAFSQFMARPFYPQQNETPLNQSPQTPGTPSSQQSQPTSPTPARSLDPNLPLLQVITPENLASFFSYRTSIMNDHIIEFLRAHVVTGSQYAALIAVQNNATRFFTQAGRTFGELNITVGQFLGFLDEFNYPASGRPLPAQSFPIFVAELPPVSIPPRTPIPPNNQPIPLPPIPPKPLTQHVVESIPVKELNSLFSADIKKASSSSLWKHGLWKTAAIITIIAYSCLVVAGLVLASIFAPLIALPIVALVGTGLGVFLFLPEKGLYSKIDTKVAESKKKADQDQALLKELNKLKKLSDDEFTTKYSHFFNLDKIDNPEVQTLLAEKGVDFYRPIIAHLNYYTNQVQQLEASLKKLQTSYTQEREKILSSPVKFKEETRLNELKLTALDKELLIKKHTLQLDLAESKMRTAFIQAVLQEPSTLKNKNLTDLCTFNKQDYLHANLAEHLKNDSNTPKEAFSTDFALFTNKKISNLHLSKILNTNTTQLANHILGY